MAIRIKRNEAGNCITFEGSSNPVYWNSCLSGEVDTTDPNTVNVVNDINTAQSGVKEYEFFRIPYEEFLDRDGNTFSTPQECADYITSNANVIGLSGEGIDLIGQIVCFQLDATSTSIVLDNGYSYGVNTIKAAPDTDGTIHIFSIDSSNSIRHFYNLEVGNVCINSEVVGGGINDVSNALNELFTVGAFDSVVISDPFSTLIANVNGEPSGYTLEGSTAIDPIGDSIFTNSSSGNFAGLKSVATINQAGEYFTFDIRGVGTIGFGLVHTQESYDNGYFSGSSTYADPTNFAVGDSENSGFQFSHWFHPTPIGSFTNFGANTSYVQGEAWYNSNTHFEARDEWLNGDPIKVKVGIDENGFIAISTLADDNVTWKLHSRTSYPVSDGAEFQLGVKTIDASSSVYSAPKVHLLDTASTPTTLGTDAITVFGEGITGTLAGGITSSATDGFDNDGFVSTQSINEVGEYFEFTWSAGDDAVVGLFSENDYNVSDLTSDTTSWSSNDYIYYGARANSGGTISSKYNDYNIPYTNVASSGGSYYGRVGFDGQGRPTVWYSSNGTDWTLFHHGNASAPSGEYKFIWVAQDDGCVFNTLQQGTIDTAPTMNFRYIESPDGVFIYPIFLTEEEANYYDTFYGGSGTSTQNVYVDEPTNTVWYAPETSFTLNGTSAPTNSITFDETPINWTEVTSLTNADLVPTQFSGIDQTFAENTSVNLQIEPQDVTYTTTVQGLPQGLSFDGVYLINGTTNYVPSDEEYVITVTRTNSYGSSQGTFTLTIQDNPSIGDLTGFTEVQGNFVQPNRIILSDVALLTYDTVLSQGQQLTYSYQSGGIPPTIGILSTQGETDLGNFDPSTDTLGTTDEFNFELTDKWDLRYVSFGGYVGTSQTKFNLVGWTDNTTLSASEGTNYNVEFKLEYSSTDNLIRLYRGGTLLKTSSTTFVGDQTLRLAGYSQSQSELYIPTNFSITNIGAGTTTPPSGFVTPLLNGEMASLTSLGNVDDSVVQIDTTLKVNHRYIIPPSWTEQNVLPTIGETGKFFIGVPKDTADWTSVTASDFWALIRLESQGTSSHTSRIVTHGSNPQDSQVTVNSLTSSYYCYGIEWDGTDLHVIACNLTSINTEPAISLGGTFSRVATYSNFATEQSKTNQELDIVIGVDLGATVNLTTSGLQQIRTPWSSRTVLVGENSSGIGLFGIVDATKFDIGGQHAPPQLSFDGITSLDAGYTYTFLYDSSMETSDFIEFRLASDGTTVYNTGITTFDGTSTGDPADLEGYKGLTFAVPTDAPPLQLYFYNSFSSSYDNGSARPISISGSTYVTPVTGITLEGPVANQTGNNLFDTPSHGWLSIDEPLGAGERLVLDNAFLIDLTDAMPNDSMVAIGLKDGSWTSSYRSNATGNAFEASARFEIFKYSSSDIRFLGYIVGGSTISKFVGVNGVLNNNVELAIDITSSGNNIRLMIGSSSNSSDDVNSTAYSDWNSSYKTQTGDQGYGLTSVDVMILGDGQTVGNLDQADADMNTLDVDWTAISEISVPTPTATNDTPWTKALAFSGSNEHLKQVSSSMYTQALQMNGLASTVGLGTRSQGETSDESLSRPWATCVVFKSDGYNANQMIWNQGEGNSSGNDNIFLNVTASGNVNFGWGREGTGYNQCRVASNISSSTWYGVYVAHSGVRLGGNNASASNLADCFDIRLMSSADSFASLSSNLSIAANWFSSGYRMDRTFAGDFTIGSRGVGNLYSYRGKVASMIVTTLIGSGSFTQAQQPGGLMYNDAQIEKMITDPIYWVNEYKVRHGLFNTSAPFRPPASQYTLMPFLIGSSTSAYQATQVWLMGDGASDSYANGVRNYIYTADQNHSKLQLNSMVSNDFENVTISGLS